MKFLNHRLAAAVFAASMVNVACAEPEGHSAADSTAGAASQSEAAAPVFNDLDKDQDGYISAVEATGDSALMDRWTAVDTNSDRKIDRTEFSKFETKAAQPGAEAPTTEGANQGTEVQQQTQDQGTESEY